MPVLVQTSRLRLLRSYRLVFCLALIPNPAICFAGPAQTTSNPGASQYAEQGLRLAQSGDLIKAEAYLRRALELAPENSAYLADLGGILGLEQKLEESTVYLSKALHLDPHNSEARRNLAASQWELGRLEEAKSNLEIVLKEKPGDLPATLILGMVCESLKDYTQAAKLLTSVPGLVASRPESIVALARSYYNTGQKEKAQGTLHSLLATATRPGWYAGIFSGGIAAANARDYATAEVLFSSIRTVYPDQAVLSYNLALAQYSSGDYRASQRTLLEAVDAGHQTSEILNLLAWCYQKQNEPREAVKAFERAIDHDPTAESNRLDLVTALFDDGLSQEALAAAKQTTHTLPGSSAAFRLQGLIELRLGHFTEAIASYGRAVELKSSDPEAVLGLAVAQSSAGFTAQAAATYEQALRRFPSDTRFYVRYAALLLTPSASNAEASESQAETLLRHAIALHASVFEAHYQLGNLALRKGNAREALEEFTTAARLRPDNPKVHFALQRTYRRLGRTEDARRELALYQQSSNAHDAANETLFPAGTHSERDQP